MSTKKTIGFIDQMGNGDLFQSSDFTKILGVRYKMNQNY